jgi:hypothetical protein
MSTLHIVYHDLVDNYNDVMYQDYNPFFLVDFTIDHLFSFVNIVLGDSEFKIFNTPDFFISYYAHELCVSFDIMERYIYNVYSAYNARNAHVPLRIQDIVCIWYNFCYLFSDKNAPLIL